MTSNIRSLAQLCGGNAPHIPSGWKLSAIIDEDCLSYLAWNESTREALAIDPKLEDLDTCLSIAQTLGGYTWLAVIDTHTHADHVSAAPALAEKLKAPLIMHHSCLSTQVNLRIAKRTAFPSRAEAIDLIPTPGHTPDGITAVWGPFIFSGDTVLYGDVGRDDLPGGNPAAHYESLKLLVSVLAPEAILLPGHDFKDGRASTWAEQLKINSSLTQKKEDFIAEAAAYDAPAPKAFKKSLVENFR